MGLMEVLASHGYVVIHSTYQTPPISPFDSLLRYDQLSAGFDQAVEHLADVLDMDLVRFAQNGACTLPANHAVPLEIALAGGNAVLDDYDVWDVRRKMHGIAACAFQHDRRGCQVSIGEADRVQADMGHWLVDGTPVASLESLRRPYPINCGPGEPCQFPDPSNPYH